MLGPKGRRSGVAKVRCFQIRVSERLGMEDASPQLPYHFVSMKPGLDGPTLCRNEWPSRYLRCFLISA